MDEPIDFLSIRLTLGLNQTQLAEKLGVAQGDLSNWETKKHQPSKLARRALEAALTTLLTEHRMQQQQRESAA